MTTLVAGTLFRSRDPTLMVENKLEPGAWIFRLVVVDNEGNESAPQDLTVSVGRVVVSPPPPPITRPIDPRLVTDPRVVTPVAPPPPPVSPTTPVRPIDPRLVIRRPPR